MLARLLPLTLLAVLVLAAPARAQGPGYAPDVPQHKALYTDGSDGRYLLGGTWLFRDEPSDPAVAAGLPSGRATDGWRPVSVPNAYNAGGTTVESMVGHPVWYRKDFRLPSADASVRWNVRFESVQNLARVYLNGHLVGSHIGAFLPFELPLKGLSRRGVNRLVVRVDPRRGTGDLPPGGFYSNGNPIGGWWNYGGLLREVYLRRVDRVDIASVLVRPHLPCRSCPATIEEQLVLRNVTSSAQRVRLRGRYGTLPVPFAPVTVPAGGSRTVSAQVRIRRPHLWSPARPTLYPASFVLSSAAPSRPARRLAGYSLHSGIRSIKVSNGRLLLNGQALHFRGVALHEDDPLLGAALNGSVRRRDMEAIKALGATLVRAHYPLHPEFQELADRMGIMLWSEVPVYQIQTRDLMTARTKRLAATALASNIAVNQNHPSVMLWSIGNELRFQQSPAEAAYTRRAAAQAKRLDPTRPVGMAVGSYPGIGCQPAYNSLDVVGLNEYFGWYAGSGGSIADRDDLSAYLDEIHACYPKKALVVSEFGFEANRNGPVDEKGTYQNQADQVAYHLGVFATKPYLAGAVYWAFLDFRCNVGWSGGNPRPDSPFHRKGLLDLFFNPKPAYAIVQRSYRSTRQLGP